MGFKGLVVTDAMTMGGVANRYGPTEPLILALQAGADILLMPHGVTEAIDAVMGAVTSGRITQSRVDESVRRILRLKAQAGLRVGRLVNLNAVDEKVNVPATSQVATEVAEKSITLARDTRNLVPIPATAKKVLSIVYADPEDIIGGRVFNSELRRGRFQLSQYRVDSRTTPAEFGDLKAMADSSDVIVASAYVFPRESRGSIGTEGGFSDFVEQLSKTGKNVIVVSFGSPYLFSAFPSSPAYLLAWGGAPVSQRAAAAALLGEIPITGRLPISIPPFFKFGEGIDRTATAGRITFGGGTGRAASTGHVK
jgi:beta-N-acetylhexosaminidase